MLESVMRDLAVMFVVSSCYTFGPIAQAANQRCGSTALAACLRRLGRAVDAQALAERLPDGGEYSSLSELAVVAREYDFAARAVKWLDQMPAGAPTAIVPIASFDNRLHFVAVLDVRGDQILVRDGDLEIWVSHAQLTLAGWDGTALHIARDEASLDAVVPGRWDGDRWREAVAAGLFVISGLMVWRSRMEGPRS